MAKGSFVELNTKLTEAEMNKRNEFKLFGRNTKKEERKEIIVKESTKY